MSDADDIRQQLRQALERLDSILDAAKHEVRKVRDLRAACAEALAGLEGKAAGLVRLAGQKISDHLQGDSQVSVRGSKADI